MTPPTPPTLAECQEVINLLIHCVQYHVCADDKITAYIKAAELITRIEAANAITADELMVWPY